MSDILVKVENVSKKFCRTLKRSLWYGVEDLCSELAGRNHSHKNLRKGEFWAVKDLSLEVRRGETLGLIGANGAGKTTLLRMLNGLIKPDAGRIEARGRMQALIALGAGFNPILTGRENIYIDAAVLGMRKAEADRRFDEIVDFSGLEAFIDTPVQSYSSGMAVRLGFAVAVHMEPDILLLDEVLAVGDKDFQIKCFQKIHQIRKKGTTVILVSHNEYNIREYSSRCLYLNSGHIRFLGSPEEAISLYIRETLENEASTSSMRETPKPKPPRKAEIVSLKFFDRDWNEISFIESGHELNIVLDCNIREELTNPIFGVNFYGGSGFMYCANSEYENITFEKLLLEKIRIKINIAHFHLPSENYLCSAVVAEENVDNLLDWHEMTYRLSVGRARNARGSIKLPTKWEVESA